MSKRMDAVAEIISDLEGCGESAGIAIGDDLQSVIDSASYEKAKVADVLNNLEGELENLVEKSTWALAELRKVMGRKP